MARLIQSPPKYHPSEWHSSNQLNYNKAEEERAQAERLRAECERLRKETDATTRRTQENIDHNFAQRIRDIEFWRQELERKLTENAEETDLLIERKERLEKALVATQFPLEVAQSCLSFREKRTSIDLVHDDVEIQLMKEVEVIQGVQALLQQTLDHTVEQIRLLKSCKYKLEKELTDKLGALGIDNTCATLTDQSKEIGFSQGAVKIQTNSVTPEQWASFSNENILRTEHERNASTTLRGVIEGITDQTKQDIERQRATVNLAFQKRIQETGEAKQSLEQHLEKILKEVEAMEGNIAQLQEAIGAKQGPMMLAHTRLGLRSQRPNIELVRDPVQYGLVGEVGQIQESVDHLQANLADSESSLKGLVRNQLTLEEDIAIKANSLFIDRDQCMALRKQLEAGASSNTT